MDLLQRETLRRAESMKLFERDGMIHYGKWREWWSASDERKAELLAKFKADSA